MRSGQIALLGLGLITATVIGWMILSGGGRAAQSDTFAPRTSANELTISPTTTAPELEAPASTSTSAAITTTTMPPPVRGSELFVSPDGVDRPEGGWNIDDPLRTPAFAVAVSQPGDTIYVLPGTYDPLTISSRENLAVKAFSGEAIFTSGSYDQLAAVLIEDSADIVVEGLRAQRSLWGLRVSNSRDVTLRGNEVIDIGQEAIHVLDKSHDVRVEDNIIDTTGQRPGGNGRFDFADFGEGIYLGTGGLLDNGEVDDVSNVVVTGNTVANTTAEAIEIKASVYNVVVANNVVRDVDVHSGAAISIGRGERHYDANVVVEGNAIWNVSTRNPWADGIGVRVSSPAIVRNNVIFNVAHFGIRVDDELRAVDGEVVVQNNLVFNNGREAFIDESVGSDVPVAESGTISGDEAVSLLAELDQNEATPAIEVLLAHLESL